MSENKLYYRGDNILLYARFKKENGEPADFVVNPMVKIVYEKNGFVETDLEWTNMIQISSNEYVYSYQIPRDSDYGLKDIIYSGEVDGKVANVYESFHIIPNATANQHVIKIYGLVHQLRVGYPLIGVNVQVKSLNDDEIYSESFTKDDGSWECFVYPGEYNFSFSKFGFKPQEYTVQIGDEQTEMSFNNVALESEKDLNKGDGVYTISDRYITKDGIPLYGLEVEAYSIYDLVGEPAGKDKTNDDGEWQLFLDPGMYLLKINGESMNQNFNYTFRLKINDNGEPQFENLSNNVAVASDNQAISEGNGSEIVEDVVKNASGDPIIDVQVNVFMPNDMETIIAQSYTDAAGVWIVYLDPGEYVFEFYHPEFNVITEERTV